MYRFRFRPLAAGRFSLDLQLEEGTNSLGSLGAVTVKHGPLDRQSVSTTATTNRAVVGITYTVAFLVTDYFGNPYTDNDVAFNVSASKVGQPEISWPGESYLSLRTQSSLPGKLRLVSLTAYSCAVSKHSVPPHLWTPLCKNHSPACWSSGIFCASLEGFLCDTEWLTDHS